MNNNTKKKRRRKNKNAWMNVVIAILAVILVVLLGLGIYLRMNDGELPSVTSSRIVVALDPGHDNLYPGSQGAMSEKEFAEEIVSRMESVLGENEKYEVLRTHDAEEDLSVQLRCEKVNDADVKLLVSIHALSQPAEQCRLVIGKPDDANYKKEFAAAEKLQAELGKAGIESEIGTYYFVPTKGNAFAMEFVSASEPEAREYETTNMHMQSKVPAVIVEVLDMENSDQSERLLNEEMYEAIAGALTNGVMAIYGE